MELDVPSAIQLTQMCGLPSEIAQQFTDVRECGIAFQKYFMDAWKAIERGNLKRLKELVENMKKIANSEPSIKGSCLNICALQSMTSLCKGEPVRFYMTLLAYAAVVGQTEMVKCLTDAGADIRMGNQLVGTPLAQMLVYCVHHKCSEKIDAEIVAKILDPTSVNAVYHYYIPTPHQQSSESTLLEFAIHLQRMDIVELLLKKGADIFATPSFNSPLVIYEYFEYGTTKVLSWFLDEYLSLKDVPAFIERVLDADILQESVIELFKVGVKRHPAHAILTCGNQDIMEKFLARYPSQDLLDVEDPNGKTALQVAAEQNNLASIKILLKLMCQKKHESDLWNANDEYRQHIIQALLLAARSGYADIVRCILQANLTLLDDSVSTTGHKLWMQAIIEGLASVYTAVYDLNPTLIVKLTDENDNSTLGHKAAEMGNSELFKVVFPLRCLGNNTTCHTEGQDMFVMLSALNKHGLTPLQVAIKKNNLNILRTLQDYMEKQKFKTGSESCKEKDEWITFWGEWGTKLLLYACSYGSHSCVKLLIEMGCQPDVSTDEFEEETPLSNAAKAGNFETVQYLLELSNITAANNSALLMAATYGHTRCVKILLEKGASVNERCPDTNHNCLMKAIENEHRDTVLAILTHNFSALRCSNGTITPMRMLIRHMPDVAEWVLNEYALVNEDRVMTNDDHDHCEIENDNQYDRDTQQKIVEQHKFELLEDFHPPRDASDSLRLEMQEFRTAGPGKAGEWMQQNYCTEIHPINLMMQLERENLLNHPLVRTLIRYKWRKVGIRTLLVYYLFYTVFLSLLTALVIILPTPGSNCTINMISIPSGNTTMTNGPMFWEVIFFYLSGTIIFAYSGLYLAFEAIQLMRRKKNYLVEYENYIQVIMFILIIIFVFPYPGNDCWYYPHWRWQVGTVGVFLAWVNSFMLLKEAPVLGQPITMLLNVYYNFIRIFYLPVLLIVTFSVPFYMIFFREEERFRADENTSAVVLTFANPFYSIWSVILYTFGGADGSLFDNDSEEGYEWLSYSLFTLFLIAMPVLFNNFLIGVAVGETREEHEKASITRIKNKVTYIFEIEDTIPYLRRFSLIKPDKLPKFRLSEDQQSKLRNESNKLKTEIKSKNHIKNVEWDVKRLQQQMALNEEELKEIKIHILKGAQTDC